MNKDVTLHFFCGKMAAGKSTLAKTLAEENNAILLVEDEWLAELYPDEISTIPEYLEYSARLKKLLSAHITALLSAGLSVVLDFPANTPRQRNWFRTLFEKSNSSHVLHFLDKDDEECKRQLKQRSKSKPVGAAFTTEAEFEEISQYFQVPHESEGFNIARYLK